jgi:hypothetical protein
LGDYNVAIGYGAANGVTACAGDTNVLVGYQVAPAIGIGDINIILGTTAGQSLSLGNSNILIGAGVAPTLSVGVGNIVIGTEAAPTLVSGAKNVIIGNGADVSSGIVFGAVSIGNGSEATLSNGLFYPTTLLGVVSGVATQFDATTGQMGPVPSSRRFKTNIQPLPTGAPGGTAGVIDRLSPMSFDLTLPEGSTGAAPRSYGFIAEDVQEICPDLVVRDAEGLPCGIEYMNILALLAQELQALKEEVRDLELQARLVAASA